jgi:hypothetical protein
MPGWSWLRMIALPTPRKREGRLMRIPPPACGGVGVGAALPLNLHLL